MTGIREIVDAPFSSMSVSKKDPCNAEGEMDEMSEEKQALLIVVSAPSGAGKSTLCNRLVEAFPTMTYSISCTTRAPRGDEKNHVHYHFLSKEEFLRNVKLGAFLEYAEVHGNYYGTLKKTVEDVLLEGRDLLMDIDVQGAAQIRAACAMMSENDPVRRGFMDLFISPPSEEELRRRLQGRATDGDDVIEKRLRNAKEEMSHREAYQYQVVNDQLEKAVDQLIGIVEKAHELRK